MRNSNVVLLVAVFTACSAPQLTAAVIPPIGLPAGSQYQLIFVTTDSIDALSSNIADYNSFVASEAALNPLLPTASWSAVVSTLSGNANGNAPSGGLPVYNTQGIEVASSSGLYTPALLNPIEFDQFGIASSSTYAWTGSDTSGFASPTEALGAGSYAIIGTVVSYGAWTEGYTGLIPTSTPMPVFALSSPITSPIPEPTSLTLLGTAVLLLGGFRFLRRRRNAA